MVGCVRAAPRWIEQRQLTIARLTEKEDEAVASATTEGDKRGRLGVAVEPLTPETARGPVTSEKQGLVVKSVQDGRPADQAGIRPGDVITEVTRQPYSRNARANAVARSPSTGGSTPPRPSQPANRCSSVASASATSPGDG